MGRPIEVEDVLEEIEDLTLDKLKPLPQRTRAHALDLLADELRSRADAALSDAHMRRGESP